MGQWVYGGSAVHIHVAAGVATLDLYVGYVTVAVAGGPPAAPTYVPNAGCAIFCF
ncbi:MAG: hypothetical protein LC623_08280 [Halobacteriales archaeon]|nr:hypothetical protein [Halobacteriales archaeon]